MAANLEDLMLDVGLANELKLAFRRAGFDNRDVKRLIEEPNTLKDIREVWEGYLAFKPADHIIDCDADPCDMKRVATHRKMGKWKWNPDEVDFYIPEAQKQATAQKQTETNNKHMGSDGYTVLEALSGKPVMNANVRDYLVAHQRLIPESWRQYRTITFWGTVYQEVRFHKSDAPLKKRVPSMWFCDHRGWIATENYLSDFGFNESNYAVVYKPAVS